MEFPVKKYDLGQRTIQFAFDTRSFISKLPYSPLSIDDLKQLTRSSGSIGANYIEASESLGKKDFLLRMKISRKEAKESIYWLRLIDLKNDDERLLTEKIRLIQEATELMKIFGSIISKKSRELNL